MNSIISIHWSKSTFILQLNFRFFHFIYNSTLRFTILYKKHQDKLQEKLNHKLKDICSYLLNRCYNRGIKHRGIKHRGIKLQLHNTIDFSIVIN